MDSEQLTVGVVAELWRYPVKSMLGQRIEAAEVTARGLAGDLGADLLGDGATVDDAGGPFG